VIFSSAMAVDDPEYALAAQRMIELAATMPGFLGIESARDSDLGITVSYWKDEDSIRAWREHPEHLDVQARGRRDWYSRYDLRVALVTRARTFSRDAD
jgi:heme-degrading monooxygenase HmoA